VSWLDVSRVGQCCVDTQHCPTRDSTQSLMNDSDSWKTYYVPQKNTCLRQLCPTQITYTNAESNHGPGSLWWKASDWLPEHWTLYKHVGHWNKPVLKADYWHCISKYLHTKHFVRRLPHNLSCFGHYPLSWVFSVTVQPIGPVNETTPSRSSNFALRTRDDGGSLFCEALCSRGQVGGQRTK
jgi:hypothetical protein